MFSPYIQTFVAHDVTTLQDTVNAWQAEQAFPDANNTGNAASILTCFAVPDPNRITYAIQMYVQSQGADIIVGNVYVFEASSPEAVAALVNDGTVGGDTYLSAFFGVIKNGSPYYVAVAQDNQGQGNFRWTFGVARDVTDMDVAVSALLAAQPNAYVFAVCPPIRNGEGRYLHPWTYGEAL